MTNKYISKKYIDSHGTPRFHNKTQKQHKHNKNNKHHQNQQEGGFLGALASGLGRSMFTGAKALGNSAVSGVKRMASSAKNMVTSGTQKIFKSASSTGPTPEQVKFAEKTITGETSPSAADGTEAPASGQEPEKEKGMLSKMGSTALSGLSGLASGASGFASGLSGLVGESIADSKKGRVIDTSDKEDNSVIGAMNAMDVGKAVKNSTTRNEEIVDTIKQVLHESWFQDQLMDNLSRNLKTQYFNKVVELNIFTIFNNIIDNITKNDNIVMAISLLKNNIPYFQELFRLSINPTPELAKLANIDDESRLFISDDNVLHLFNNTSSQFSKIVASNFNKIINPELFHKEVQQINDKDGTNNFQHIRANYLLNLAEETEQMKKEEEQFKEKKEQAREERFKRMVEQNIDAKVSSNITEADKTDFINYFNNMETDNENAIIIDGKRYNEIIVNIIGDAIKSMLDQSENKKELVKIILKRFDYMLKEYIDVLQTNGIIKILLFRIFEKHPFIFTTFNKGIEDAFNKKIAELSSSKQTSEAYITKGQLDNDFSFFTSIIDSITKALTETLTTNNPTKPEDDDDVNFTFEGGKRAKPITKPITNKHKEKLKQYLKKNLTKRKQQSHTGEKPPVGWLW